MIDGGVSCIVFQTMLVGFWFNVSWEEALRFVKKLIEETKIKNGLNKISKY